MTANNKKKLSKGTQKALQRFLEAYPMADMQAPFDAIHNRLFTLDISHEEFCMLNEIHEELRKQHARLKEVIALKTNNWEWCPSCFMGDPHYRNGCPECEQRMLRSADEKAQQEV